MLTNKTLCQGGGIPQRSLGLKDHKLVIMDDKTEANNTKEARDGTIFSLTPLLHLYIFYRTLKGNNFSCY